MLFQGFGEWVLNFELRCFVGDTDKLGVVRSDLCFAIDDTFRANGIEIPFPQRVVRPGAPPAARDGGAQPDDSAIAPDVASVAPRRPAADGTAKHDLP